MSIALQSDVIASRRDHYQLMRVARSRAHNNITLCNGIDMP